MIWNRKCTSGTTQIPRARRSVVNNGAQPWNLILYWHDWFLVRPSLHSKYLNFIFYVKMVFSIPSRHCLCTSPPFLPPYLLLPFSFPAYSVSQLFFFSFLTTTFFFGLRKPDSIMTSLIWFEFFFFLIIKFFYSAFDVVAVKISCADKTS